MHNPVATMIKKVAKGITRANRYFQSTKLPELQLESLIAERSNLRAQLSKFLEHPPFVPAGHYYSPIPSLDEVKENEDRIFQPWPQEIPGIDLREKVQLALLEEFSKTYGDLPFTAHKSEKLRYHYENPSYSYSDAIFLNSMIRYAKPKRIVEIGSGYSSCLILDTNEIWFENSIDCSFIEPYPELFLSLLKNSDIDRVRLFKKRAQDIDLSLISALQENDILFVDSTHVSKIGSDVNHIFFNILPILAPGVLVHFHDIFYPFEYPKDWILKGIAWNEAYMLRAFLYKNSAFEIVAYNTYLSHFHKDYFEKNMPLCLLNTGGSIWIRKTLP